MQILVKDTLIETFHVSFEHTVPRSLVHKKSLENVLLTEVRGCTDDRFVCEGRIPTSHRFFNDAGRTPQKDILFYTELGRQASLAVSHTFLGVSTGDVFIFEESQAWMKDAAWISVPESAADSIVTEITLRETERRRNNAVSRVVADQLMSIGGVPMFHGTGAWTVQTAALFQRLRRMSKPRTSLVAGEIPVELSRVVRDNVVILGTKSNEDRTEFVTSLIVDETHPYFFDHPCDHVPGMLLLEGCTQLVQAAVSMVTSAPSRQFAISGYDVNFRQFVECDLPVTITVRFDRTDRNRHSLIPARAYLSISQQDVLCGTATVSVALLS